MRIIGRTDDLLIVRGVNVYPAAIRDVIASFAPKLNGVMEIQMKQAPPIGWEPPIHIKVELGLNVEKDEKLKERIELKLREKLIFRADIQIVPEGSLPRYEYKAKLVRELYKE